MKGYAALVTGASRGIGRGIANALAAEGFSIAVNDLVHGEEVEETLASLRQQGVKAVAVIGDVSDVSIRKSLLENAEIGIGPLTTLVNNAGVSVLRRGDLLDVTPESLIAARRSIRAARFSSARPGPSGSCGGRATTIVTARSSLSLHRTRLRFRSRGANIASRKRALQ